MKRQAKTINVSDIAERETSFAKEVLAPLAGMGLTFTRMMQNVSGKIRPTISYPEERRSYSERYRGAHILTARPDGSPRCVACYMCATACPADCIYIEPGEHPDPLIEKFPTRFEIDMLRCVFCGFCVDACPKDAIWMTRDYELAFFSREDAIFGIDKLIEKPGLPVKDGYGYRPYYPGDGTNPPRDASAVPVTPGQGDRSLLREKGVHLPGRDEGPGPLNAPSQAESSRF
ncbi:MAG TPA: NADH-quinone oxidoreductase subunit I [Blastocatellia bacterium]